MDKIICNVCLHSDETHTFSWLVEWVASTKIAVLPREAANSSCHVVAKQIIKARLPPVQYNVLEAEERTHLPASQLCTLGVNVDPDALTLCTSGA